MPFRYHHCIYSPSPYILLTIILAFAARKVLSVYLECTSNIDIGVAGADTACEKGFLSKPTWDRDCKRFHHKHFGCHNFPCSPENEAAFLGIHATINGKFFFEENGTNKELGDVWEKFVRMDVPDELLEYVDAVKFDELKRKLPPGKIPTIKFIPRSCDLQAFLYCESTIEPPDGETKSLCNCHPMYSVAHYDQDLDRTTCKGRPGVPCEYDGTATQQFFGKEMSLCMDQTTCKGFTDKKAENAFRNGETFHAFGYSPIMARYMWRHATKVCTCNAVHSRTNLPLTQNKMHACIAGKKKK